MEEGFCNDLNCVLDHHTCGGLVYAVIVTLVVQMRTAVVNVYPIKIGTAAY